MEGRYSSYSKRRNIISTSATAYSSENGEETNREYNGLEECYKVFHKYDIQCSA